MSDKIVNLIEYYPEFLQEVYEYKAITDAQNPEFNLLYKRLTSLENNLLPLSAEEHGVEIYEKWLNIPSNPYLTLDERKGNILAKLNETLPYTEIRLQKMLAAICGWGHFTYKRTGAYVQVLLDPTVGDKGISVYRMLDRVLPLNLYFDVILNHVNETDTLEFGIGGQEKEIIETRITETGERISMVYLQNGSIQTEIVVTRGD